MSTQMPSSTKNTMSLEVTFNQDTDNPVWNDNENDRLLWRAAEVRKLRRPATRCAGRRRIVRREDSRDCRSAWAGIRPLPCAPHRARETARQARSAWGRDKGHWHRGQAH